jgi:hypothetical protein
MHSLGGPIARIVDQLGIQVRVTDRFTDLVSKHQEMLEKITSYSSTVGQEVANASHCYFKVVREVSKIENDIRFERVMKALEDGFSLTTRSLEKIVQSQVEIAGSGCIDPEVFTKYIEINVELMREVTRMTRK